MCTDCALLLLHPSMSLTSHACFDNLPKQERARKPKKNSNNQKRPPVPANKKASKKAKTTTVVEPLVADEETVESEEDDPDLCFADQIEELRYYKGASNLWIRREATVDKHKDKVKLYICYRDIDDMEERKAELAVVPWEAIVTDGNKNILESFLDKVKEGKSRIFPPLPEETDKGPERKKKLDDIALVKRAASELEDYLNDSALINKLESEP